MMKLFSVLAALFFILAGVLELYLQSTTQDYGMKTFHRVGFFGWLILANLEFIYLHVSGDKSKST